MKDTYHILLVEDDELMRESMSDLLDVFGYQSISAQTGLEGIQLLLNNHSEFDLVISDLNMPDMDGFDLLDKMYADQDLKQIPVLMVSGERNLNTLRNSFKNGAIEYITKPFKNEELIESIENILNVDGQAENVNVKKHKDLSLLQNKINHVNEVNSHALRHENSKILQVLQLHNQGLVDAESALNMIGEMGEKIEEITKKLQNIMDTNIESTQKLINDSRIQNINKVWFIDDDKLTNMMHNIMAEKFLGHDFEVFEDPQKALDNICDSSDYPDLIFLDLNMPFISGFDFLETLKSENINIPVIVLSSSIQQSDISKSLTYKNVITYITKPLQKEILMLLNSSS